MPQIQNAAPSQEFPKEPTHPNLPWKVYTHYWSHFDEHASLAMLLKYGPRIHGLEGIGNHEIHFVDAGSAIPQRLAKRDWLWERIAAIGVFGDWGPFDEHPGPAQRQRGQPRKRKQSAASLTLQFLKKRIPGFDDPRAEALAAYATRIDTEGGATRDSLANIVKSMNWLGNEKKTIEWVLKGIRAYMETGDPKEDAKENAFDIETIGALIPEEERMDWLLQGHAARQWEYKIYKEAVTAIKKGPKELFDTRFAYDKYGAKRKIVATESGNPLMTRAIFSILRADVAIVKNEKTGHVAILTGTQAYIDLTGLVRMLNRRELELRHDNRHKHLPFVQLSPEGSLLGSVWASQLEFKHPMCLNGSPSSPSVDPTKIPLKRIAAAAEKALDETRFSTEAEGYACDGTSCGPEAKKSCSFYRDGLPRCIKIRSEARRANGTPRTEKPKAKVIPISTAPKAKQAKPQAPVSAHKPAPVANTALADKLAEFRSKLMY